jgi:hypothetical protein
VAVDGALGAGASGQVDAADDAGCDPDGRLFKARQNLQVEVTAQDESDVVSDVSGWRGAGRMPTCT